MRVLRGAHAADALATAHHEHQAILRALTARDPLLAASAAAVHIAAVEQWLQDVPPEQSTP